MLLSGAHSTIRRRTDNIYLRRAAEGCGGLRRDEKKEKEEEKEEEEAAQPGLCWERGGGICTALCKTGFLLVYLGKIVTNEQTLSPPGRATAAIKVSVLLSGAHSTIRCRTDNIYLRRAAEGCGGKRREEGEGGGGRRPAWPVLGERWRYLYSTVQNRFSTCLPGENCDERTDYLAY